MSKAMPPTKMQGSAPALMLSTILKIGARTKDNMRWSDEELQKLQEMDDQVREHWLKIYNLFWQIEIVVDKLPVTLTPLAFYEAGKVVSRFPHTDRLITNVKPKMSAEVCRDEEEKHSSVVDKFVSDLAPTCRQLQSRYTENVATVQDLLKDVKTQVYKFEEMLSVCHETFKGKRRPTWYTETVCYRVEEYKRISSIFIEMWDWVVLDTLKVTDEVCGLLRDDEL